MNHWRFPSLIAAVLIAALVIPPVISVRGLDDDTPPSVPGRLRTAAATQATIALTWQESHDFESEISHYEIERDGIIIGSATATLFTATGMLPATSHLFRVRAINGVGLASAWSLPLTALTQAPPPAAFPSLAQRGAWCWFGDPRAVQVGNFTYTGWIDWNGDVVVAKYDNRSGSVQTNMVRSALEVDDHDNPSVILRPDGRLLVFYSKHAGSQMYYRLSNSPYDIAAWGTEQSVPGTTLVTYPNPYFLSDEGNALYLFWRGADAKPTFAVSPDGGATWGPSRTVIDTGPYTVSYVKYASNGRDRIDIAFTDTHPEKSAVNNVYHITYRDGAFYRADGTLAKTESELPITPGDADLVYDATAQSATGWVWDIALDRTDRPVIAYTNFPSSSDHRYRYARWTGSGWFDTEITGGGGSIDESGDDPFYSGGAALDPNNPAIVYVSKQVGAAFELERWTTANGGASWSAQPITTGSSAKNVRPFVPRNHQPGSIGLLWLYGGYTSYTQYETRPLFRVDPPLRRSQPQQVTAP